MEVCPQCKERFSPRPGNLNRARKIGAPIYCGRRCAGLARRGPFRTVAQKKEEKRLYDLKRRKELHDELLAQKRKYWLANREAILKKMVVYRKKIMPRHVEYCRQPKYRAYKQGYDIAQRMSEYGEFGEAWRTLLDLEKEIRRQATNYERRVMKGCYTRTALTRRRELWVKLQTTR